jgi:integrase
MKPRARSFDTKGEAERWARDLEAQVDRCGAAPDTRLIESTTLGVIMERYKMEVSPTKRGAKQEIERLDVLGRHELAHRTLAGLSSAHVATYRDERLKHVAPATVVRELALISHVLEIARREWGFPLSLNVVKQVRRPTISNARSRRLVGGEEQRLLDGCDAGRTPCLKSLMIVAIETAMRRGELLSLRWCDVDFEQRVAHLALTKNGNARQVPLSSRAINAMLVLRTERTAVTDKLFPLRPGSLEQTWMRLRERTGIHDLRFHDLRHEAVSRLFERGLGIAEVSAISGHKEVRMLTRYCHLRAADLAERLR